MKPRVRYADVALPVRMGGTALLVPVDHPNLELNSQWIRTSTVQKVIDQARGPVFETRNTIYHPGETDESLPKLKQMDYAK